LKETLDTKPSARNIPLLRLGQYLRGLTIAISGVLYRWRFAVMPKALEFLAILIIILLIISVVMLPWPGNIVIGGLLALTVIVTFVYERRAKKKS